MFDHFSNRRNHGVERRGVGAIIGGVILAAILLTTVLVYFVSILNNEKAKTGYEMLSSQANQERATEKFGIDRNHDLVGGNMMINITNVGSIPMRYSHVLLYCISPGCTSTEPIINPASVLPPPSVTVNAGERRDGVAVGPLSNGLTYRADVISERGNIASAIECKVNVNGSICENDATGGGDEDEPICVICEATKGIIQGTGSLQLDFKSFGAIFPNFGTRNGVDQTGWSAKAGNATGYPASTVPKVNAVVLVERMRNFDSSQENITLTRHTGLSITLGKAQGNTPTIVYICTENVGLKTISAYTSDTKVLPYTIPNGDLYAGFTDVYFCAQDDQASGTIWNPTSDSKFDNINGIFMVARGYFGEKSDFYSQVVPYQSLLISNVVNSCLKTTSALGSLTCQATNSAASNSGYLYSATAPAMQGPVNINVRLETINHGPYSIDWIYPSSGKHVTLANNVMPVGNNIPITLPTKMEDGTANITPGFYSLVVTSNYYKANPSDSQYSQDVYYMTFQVT